MKYVRLQAAGSNVARQELFDLVEYDLELPKGALSSCNVAVRPGSSSGLRRSRRALNLLEMRETTRNNMNMSRVLFVFDRKMPILAMIERENGMERPLKGDGRTPTRKTPQFGDSLADPETAARRETQT